MKHEEWEENKQGDGREKKKEWEVYKKYRSIGRCWIRETEKEEIK